MACLTAVTAIAGCGETQIGDPHGQGGGTTGADSTPPAAAASPGAIGGSAASGAGSHGAGAGATGAGGAGSGATGPGSTGSGSTGSGSTSSASGRQTAPGGAGVAHEVADPEEARSFPVSGTIHHSAAATPSKSGEAAVAAGAPSDAEVRAELAQMHAAQQNALRTGHQALATVPGGESIGGDGALPIPAGVPEVIQKVVAGANAIADFPYVYGGGHASFVDNAYDCSGSVSYALAAGGLLSAPETSGELESWGVPGPGKYITVYANAGHTYMYVDGILFDTAGRSGPYASRWQAGGTDNTGYVVRHYPGL